jgi:hypothetical protein
VAIASQVLGAAGVRWPMYVRNAKQVFRAASFDERRYGYGGLMDLLRALQRDGFVRLERDRRGGLRAFQGSALAGLGTARTTTPPEPITSLEPEIAAIEGDAPLPPPDAIEDADIMDVQPQAVVDTTAELLGRATSRKPRTVRAARRSETKKPARGATTRRGPRRKIAADES